jgi:hypothetical protein
MHAAFYNSSDIFGYKMYMLNLVYISNMFWIDGTCTYSLCSPLILQLWTGIHKLCRVVLDACDVLQVVGLCFEKKTH